MTETIKQPDHQFYIFVVGIILFGIIAVLGWIKLQYGFAFMDEGYHMVEGWRLSAGDHFIRDVPTGMIANWRLFTKVIFDLWPGITLLSFRKIQFFLTLISLFIFGSALYRYDKQYWYLPFTFSVFAFTGLDPLGATSNLSYYTYPHLFIALHIASLLLGIRARNSLVKSLLFLFSGACLYGISLSLLHQSPVIAGPVALYILAKFLNFKQIEFRSKDLALVLAPFFLFWAIFLIAYNTDYIHSILSGLNRARDIRVGAPYLYAVIWSGVLYTVIIFIIAFSFLMVLNTFKPYKIIYLIFLSILTFFIIDTSLFGTIKPYWKDWFSRPMWFAGLLISFHLIFWLHIITKRFFLKRTFKPHEELIILLMLPSTLLFIPAATFSGFGTILVLHSAIPTVTAIALIIMNLEPIRPRSNAFKLIILALAFAPFYYTTAWSDWNFTYCDVKPEHANAIITDGFLKGIHTNSVYKQINDWIKQNTAMYSNKDEFIISYILSPMVYMIAERRPAIEESFLCPPVDWYMKRYRPMIENMKASHRLPSIAFVFDNSPALITINEKSKIKLNLKGDTYNFFGSWYNFQTSVDPLADYIRKNMTMVESITYQDHTALCFVDNKRLVEKSLQQSLNLPPESFQALNRLAMQHIKEKNYTDAIALLSGAMLKLQPDNADIYYNIACLFSLQDNQEKAIDWLRRAIEKGYDRWEKINTDPDLENIRNLEYFQKIKKNNQ
jgi:tetratricopeptide (TPR) repeat protein